MYWRKGNMEQKKKTHDWKIEILDSLMLGNVSK